MIISHTKIQWIDLNRNFYPIIVVVDCEWSLWSPWGDCFCSGKRYANRQIQIPPANGGDSCKGSTLKTESCIPTENCEG